MKDPAAIYPFYLKLMASALKLARIENRHVDLAAARVAYDDLLFAIGEAERLNTPAALNEAAAKDADFTVLLGLDTIPGFIESHIFPDLPVDLEVQRKLIARDLSEARKRARR